MKLRYFIAAVFVITQFFTFAEAQKNTKKQEREKIEKLLTVYTTANCDFSNVNLLLLKTDRIAKDQKDQNLVRETTEGTQSVSRTDGSQMIFAQKTDKYIYANFRVDRSRPESYENDKKVVRAELQKLINTSQNIEGSKPSEKNYNSFPSYSLTRSNVIGNTIGITLLFDDKNYIIMTAYFMNMPANIKPENKLFGNIGEWKTERDNFLSSYTQCVAKNL